MYCAYVLKSVNHDYFYKGHCKDIEKRIVQLNSGMTESLSPYLPFLLFYKEDFETEEEAMEREKYLNHQYSTSIK